MRKLQENTQLKKYTIQEVLTYMDCPMCYHLQYVEQRDFPDQYLANNKNIAYQEAMLETIRYFYMELQRKKPPTYKKVCDKFYRLWLEKTDTLDTMSILTREFKNSTKKEREEQSKYIQEGYASLEHFYTYNNQTKQAILAVNEPYSVRLGDSQVTGNFQVIREIMHPKKKLREIQLVNFQLGKHVPSIEDLNQDLTLLTMGLGFKQMYGIHPDQFVLYYPNADKEVVIEHTLNKYKQTIHTLNAFRLSVENIPPYVRPGAHRGHSPFKSFCENYDY